MELIVITFSQNNQDFDKIKNVLALLSKKLDAKSGNVVAVHGFLSRFNLIDRLKASAGYFDRQLINKTFGSSVIDAITYEFPINCFTDTHREDAHCIRMSAILRKQNGTVYVIGEVKRGVLDEVNRFISENVNICQLQLDWDGLSMPPFLDKEQMSALKKELYAREDEFAREEQEFKKRIAANENGTEK